MSRKALLVGINNFITLPNNSLNGCVNDTIQMHEILTTFYGFTEDCIKILRDHDATSQGLRDGLAWLLSDYDSNDVRVFHFSSHGTQVADLDGDETDDASDEVIVPADHDWDAPFTDDKLRAIFQTVPEHVNFTFLADCCHSGTIQKALLERKINFKARFLTPPRAVQDEITALTEQRKREIDEYSVEKLLEWSQTLSPAAYQAKLTEFLAWMRRRSVDNRFDVVDFEKHVLFGACQSSQTAADAEINPGDFHGAFTWAFFNAVKNANGNLTYGEAIKGISELLKNYEQRPQLECPAAIMDLKLFAPLA